jgi:hypothetical protein
MSITSQRFAVGQWVATATRSSFPASVAEFVINWHFAFLRPSPVGTRSRRCEMPGYATEARKSGSKPSGETKTQNHSSMKNARKQLGTDTAANYPSGVPQPPITTNADDFSLIENDAFSHKPEPRQPESPDAESFRSLLKTNLPRHQASPTLLQRIHNISRHDKD